jgi:hypothetical protein
MKGITLRRAAFCFAETSIEGKREKGKRVKLTQTPNRSTLSWNALPAPEIAAHSYYPRSHTMGKCTVCGGTGRTRCVEIGGVSLVDVAFIWRDLTVLSTS